MGVWYTLIIYITFVVLHSHMVRCKCGVWCSKKKEGWAPPMWWKRLIIIRCNSYWQWLLLLLKETHPFYFLTMSQIILRGLWGVTFIGPFSRTFGSVERLWLEFTPSSWGFRKKVSVYSWPTQKSGKQREKQPKSVPARCCVPHCPTDVHLPLHRCDRQLSLASVPLGKSDLDLNEPGIQCDGLLILPLFSQNWKGRSLR